MQQVFPCLAVLVVGCVLLQPTVSSADSCVMYHKRAPVKGVCGCVSNVAGDKLKNVEITLARDGDSVLFNTRSDSKGSFSFGSIPEGNYTLHIKASGYREVQRDLRVSRSEKQCEPTIDVKLGLRVCDTGTYVKGVDKPSDLDAGFRNGRDR